MSLLLLACGALPAAAQGPANAVVEYYHLDAIGSVRAVTDATGAVVRRHDYFPFGEEAAPPPGADPLRFAGKARDAETGLDYFQARYYASRAGRFTTVDPGHVGGNILDPQSWNAYAYSRNNPFRFVDPTGTEYEVRLGNGATLYLTNDQFDRLRDNPGAGISFDGFWDSGDIWINNGGTRYGSYRYYYGFSDAIRDAGNRAESELKAYVEEMALNAATIGFFRGIGIGAELATRHGAARIAGAAATRGGVLTMGEISAVRAAGRLVRQADGAIVRVLRVGDRFNVVVEGQRGIITTFKNLSQKSLDGLARRYGWK